MGEILHLFVHSFIKDLTLVSPAEGTKGPTASTPTHCYLWEIRVLQMASFVRGPRHVHTFTCQKLRVSKTWR